jgi:hypothetical protein
MARPTLADSLRSSLLKGVHVDTAAKIARGLPPIPDGDERSALPSSDVQEKTPSIHPRSSVVDISNAKSSPRSAVIGKTIEPTNNQANNRTINQTDNQAGKQTINRAVEQTVEQTIQQLTQQSDSQSNNQTVEQSTEQSTRQSDQHSYEQTIRQSPEQPIRRNGKQSQKQIYLPLNENQGRILLFLYEQGQGLTNMDTVCEETGIAYGTARTAIDVLMKDGYVTSKDRHNGHSFKGFEYTLNNHLCSLYATRVRGEQSVEQSTWQSIQQSSRQSNNQTTGQTINRTVAPFSRSSLLTEKLTTTEDPLFEPELRYWKEKGVTARQVEKWAEEFSMDIEMVLQSLKHCRFEMVVLNFEEEKPIANPMNWFYKVMQRSGFYPRPAEYKSMAELRAEQMEQAARELSEARNRQAAAEAELSFQQLLADPSSDDYQALLSHVDSFAKDMGGKALETALREVYLNGKP